MARRQDWGALLSYHATTIFRGNSIHYCCFDHSDSAEVCRHDAYGAWCLHGLCCRIGVDIKYFATTCLKGTILYQSIRTAYAYETGLQRAAALAAINAVSNTSSIYASYMYPESAGPRYSKLPKLYILVKHTTPKSISFT